MELVYGSAGLLVLTGLLFTAAYWKGRKEADKVSRSGILGMAQTAGWYLAGRGLFRKYRSRQVKNALLILHPTSDPEVLLRTYYSEKIAICLLFLMAGLFLSGVLAYSNQKESILQQGNRLMRGGYEEDSRQVNLIITRREDGSSRELPFSLLPRTYSQRRLEELMAAFEKQLPNLILGNNPSLEEVTEPLALKEQYEGYPFQISWQSGDYTLIDDDGSVKNEELTGPVAVMLTAEGDYREFHFETAFPVVLMPQPVTEQERAGEQIATELSRLDKAAQQQESLQLPDRLLGKEVSYRIKEESGGWLYPVGVICLSVILYLSKDRDLSEALKKRHQRLEAAYPDFVEKFVLLFGAGLNVRNIFLRLEKDETTDEVLRGELMLLRRDLGNGILEYEAYDRFAGRIGSRMYTALVSLLIQNQKKGNTELLKMLEEAAGEAFTIRKNLAKKRGEEASTKLLVPMMMLLGVVMVVIILPAFMAF